jgi:peptidyl-tRNA hydrolase, PTH1 family
MASGPSATVRRLLVGLGNPGAAYAKTRHNVGFMVLDRFQQGYVARAQQQQKPPRRGSPTSPTSAVRLDAATHSLGMDLVDLTSERRRLKTQRDGLPFPRVEASLLKPMTFMNRSGHETAEFLRAREFKLRRNPASENKMDEMLVIYDDLAVPFGKMTLKPKGGHGGHNGIRDIIKRVGHDKFPRLRVGIGGQVGGGGVGGIDHVLSRFDAQEQKKLPLLLDFACAVLRVYLHRGFPAAARVVNDPGADLEWFAEMRRKAIAAQSR